MTRTKKTPSVRAVFFDIGNVLLRFNARTFIDHIAQASHRSPLTVAGYMWIERLSDKLERGHIAPRQFFNLFRVKLGYQGDWASFSKAWCDFTPNPKTELILSEVRRNHKVYLLSNTNAIHYDFIREHYDFVRHAHGALLSYRLGLRKPEPAIYRAALARAHILAQEAAFIDDLKENIAAAAQLGIKTVHYKEGIDLRKELKALGVLV